MGGSSRNRERELAEQNRVAQQQLATAQAAYVPTELEKRTEKGALDWLDFVEGKNGPVDYTKAPGLVHLGMADEAVANRFAERTATGGLQMGKDGANATAIGLRKEHLADQMREARGRDLTSAVRAKDASVRGEITPFLIGTAEGRNQSKVAAAGGQASSARNAYAAYQPPTPWWQIAASAGLGTAGQIFAGKG